MPRGQHPKSRSNLDRGVKFASSDGSARKGAQASAQSRAARASIAEEMRGTMTNERRNELARVLIDNMGKSPAWFQLGLRMLGELPPEQMEVSRPAEEVAQELREALEQRRREVMDIGK